MYFFTAAAAACSRPDIQTNPSFHPKLPRLYFFFFVVVGRHPFTINFQCQHTQFGVPLLNTYGQKHAYIDFAGNTAEP